MSKRRKTNAIMAVFAPPPASLRLLASPLQLTYAYIWQVIQQRDVRKYSRVEEFVATVTQTVPDLLSFKQTAQLLLGLRARIILDLLQPEAAPDPKTIQTLINKLNVCHTTKDAEVEQSQTNFMVLVQMLLKSVAQRKQFFQDVFPVKYGSSFDTALQTLIAELVCKLEQLLPVPNLSQLGAMISTSMEACAQFIPDPSDLKILLNHQDTSKPLKKAISSNVGNCVLSSLSYCPAAVEPPKSPERVETSAASAASPASPASFSDTDDVGDMDMDMDSEDHQVSEIPATPMDRRSSDATSTDPAGQKHQEDSVETNTAASTPLDLSSQKKTQEVSGTKEYTCNQDRAETEELQSQTTTPSGNPPDRPELRESPLSSIPLKTAHTSTQNASASPNAGSTDTSTLKKLPTKRVTLQQWVSKIAINSLSLPALPPIPPLKMTGGEVAGPEMQGQKNSPSFPGLPPIPPLKKRGGSASPEKQRQRVKTKTKPPVEYFDCETCKKRFRCQSELLDHERIHTGETPYPCTACGKSFRSQSLLTKHKKIHSGVRAYSCGHCGRAFISMSALKKHIDTHLGKKPFHCEICNKGFTQNSYFKRHMEGHTSQVRFACKHCDKTFPTEFKLEQHQRVHVTELPHMCETCGKRFLMPCMLKRHMGYHIGEKPFLCSQCGKTFVYEDDMKRHQRYHAPKVKTTCPICQKTFAKGSLKTHMMTHTKEKPHRCPHCGKTFSQLGNLRVHKRQHSKERPYRCDDCGKTYKHSSHLSVHKKSHTGERPWKCDICGKGFIFPGTLKKHMLLHTGFSSKRRHKSKQKTHSLRRKYEDDDNDDY